MPHSDAARLRCQEIGSGFLGGARSRLTESVLTFDKSQYHKLDSAVPQRSARRPDRVLALTAHTVLRARRIASVVPDSMLRIRCMTTVLSVTCRTTPRSWGRTGGHGSADPGLGMNRAPDRLYLAVWLSCVRVGCGSRGTTLCASLENLEKQRQEPARALMARDLLVR